MARATATKSVRYEAQGWFKMSDEDVFASGCVAQGACFHGGQGLHHDVTVAGLIERLCTSIGSTSPEDVLMDSCDEPGRVDIQVHEREDGRTADKADIKAWKAGKLRLWLCTYSFHVQRVTRETLPLTQGGK